MKDLTLSLASEFEKPVYKDWLDLVQTQLKNPDAIRQLSFKTYDDIIIRPLYNQVNAHAASPGKFPFTRSCSNKAHAWAITQAYSHPDPSIANELIQEDLSKGVTQIRLLFSEVTRRVLQPSQDEPLSSSGLKCFQLNQLDLLLKNVSLERVPIELQAGAAFLEYSALLMALAKKRQLNHKKLSFFFNADPAGHFAEFGELPSHQNTLLERLTTLSQTCIADFPESKAVGVSGAVYHNAGASQAQEIGAMLATGVTYLRAMVDSGTPINQACTQIQFTLSADSEFFQSISKFRVLRELWAQICKISGADEGYCKIHLNGESSKRMLTQRDPWINLLRNTIATSAAAIGGAESICCYTFDSALGHYSSLGHRMSRNTALLLQDESSLHKSIDPIGGSYFIENYCAQLREESWSILQMIESDGGVFESLKKGGLQRIILAVQQKRTQKINTRQQPLTGISEFATLNESTMPCESLDTSLTKTTGIDIKSHVLTENLEVDIPGIIQAYLSGHSTQEISDQSRTDRVLCTPLPPKRLSEAFEALRHASNCYYSEYAKRPELFVITIGSASHFSARLSFTKNFFAAGGIDVRPLSYESLLHNSAKIGDIVKSSAAVICSNDNNYKDTGEEVVDLLRKSGVKTIYVTGKALDSVTEVQLTLSCNIIDILKHVHKLLGVTQ